MLIVVYKYAAKLSDIIICDDIRRWDDVFATGFPLVDVVGALEDSCEAEACLVCVRRRGSLLQFTLQRLSLLDGKLQFITLLLDPFLPFARTLFLGSLSLSARGRIFSHKSGVVAANRMRSLRSAGAGNCVYPWTRMQTLLCPAERFLFLFHFLQITIEIDFQVAY